jgi:hypothetical protein
MMMQRVRCLARGSPASKSRAEQDDKPLSEGHIYDALNMSMAVPWRRVA